MGVGALCHALAALLPARTQYPLYRKVGEPQGQSGWVQKILSPPQFDSWTTQPTVSHYIDYAITKQHKHMLFSQPILNRVV
jgi:hypothetical protein